MDVSSINVTLDESTLANNLVPNLNFDVSQQIGFSPEDLLTEVYYIIILHK